MITKIRDTVDAFRLLFWVIVMTLDPEFYMWDVRQSVKRMRKSRQQLEEQIVKLERIIRTPRIRV